MGEAKELRVLPIDSSDARKLIERLHYSGKATVNARLALGVLFRGKLEGAMQFGPPLDKAKVLPLVRGTGWNEMLELNRMAFSDALPRNSESRALGVALRLLRKHYPVLKWVLSFSDATRCGDGTIYRAAGFLLTNIKPNSTLWEMPDGRVFSDVGVRSMGGRMPDVIARGAKKLRGFQLRYIYFLQPKERQNLAVEALPFSAIERAGASMYRGKRGRSIEDAPDVQSGEGGSTPTLPLHPSEGSP